MNKVLNINGALIIYKNKELSANSEFHGGGGKFTHKRQDNDFFFLLFFLTKMLLHGMI